MTKSRNEYIYEFTGTIHKRYQRQVSQKSKYAGEAFYDLSVSLKNPHQHIKHIQVFQRKLENPQIWDIIQQTRKFPAKYKFLCRNHRGFYYLVNWEETN